MAPIRQPALLQTLCLESASEVLLCYASLGLYHNYLEYHYKRFQALENFVQEHVPSLLRCNLFHTLIKRMSQDKSQGIEAKMIVFFMKALITPEVQHLSFSDLIYAGAVDYDVLDSFETGFALMFPYLPRLSHLDLSTHKSEVSLPSCSYNILLSIGKNCPNLRILNLNNNNRVTDDCLKCLTPKKYGNCKGCLYLEEIYIQECSISDRGIIWLLKTFPYLQKVGHSDMGSILRKYIKPYRKYSSRYWPWLNLTYIDNTESTYVRSDGSIISLISDICPYAENVRVRVCDEDCYELYRLQSLIKLELRFYTGTHHLIGNITLNYLQEKGCLLSSLTIFCNQLESYHVSIITKACVSLNKLFLHCNTFVLNQHFNSSDNSLSNLKVLTIRVGQHEMDESPLAGPLVKFLMKGGLQLEEIYLLLVCRFVNHNFFKEFLSTNELPKLQTFIYDAPRRNRELPVIPLCSATAIMMLEKCPSLETIGNLISWQVTPPEVCQLKEEIRKRNYEGNVIYALQNRLNTKYF